ncbi:hypothetical protein [Thalassobacillus pellis]|uniref:hypothetical protein n=1 Tax=Thalassobacillus pellis TaxID=748008 RepID=UPI0019609915|nr:hypothetical protein [Thalassobacillus pellis]MBM7553083.1 hypothetical protein [Thalassobacillus pellis]
MNHTYMDAVVSEHKRRVDQVNNHAWKRPVPDSKHNLIHSIKQYFSRKEIASTSLACCSSCC